MIKRLFPRDAFGGNVFHGATNACNFRANRVLFRAALLLLRTALLTCRPTNFDFGEDMIARLFAGAVIIGASVLSGAARAEDKPLIPRGVLFGNPDHASVQLSHDGKQISYLAAVDGVIN